MRDEELVSDFTKLLESLKINCDVCEEHSDIDFQEMETSLRCFSRIMFSDDEDYLLEYADNCMEKYVIIEFQSNYCGGFNFEISSTNTYPEWRGMTDAIVIPSLSMYNILVN